MVTRRRVPGPSPLVFPSSAAPGSYVLIALRVSAFSVRGLGLPCSGLGHSSKTLKKEGPLACPPAMPEGRCSPSDGEGTMVLPTAAFLVERSGSR